MYINIFSNNKNNVIYINGNIYINIRLRIKSYMRKNVNNQDNANHIYIDNIYMIILLYGFVYTRRVYSI